jgi:hypothetical protein
LLNQIQFCYTRSSFYDIIAKNCCIPMYVMNLGGHQKGLGAYEIIKKKNCYIPTYVMDLGRYK